MQAQAFYLFRMTVSLLFLLLMFHTDCICWEMQSLSKILLMFVFIQIGPRSALFCVCGGGAGGGVPVLRNEKFTWSTGTWICCRLLCQVPVKCNVSCHAISAIIDGLGKNGLTHSTWASSISYAKFESRLERFRKIRKKGQWIHIFDDNKLSLALFQGICINYVVTVLVLQITTNPSRKVNVGSMR